MFLRQHVTYHGAKNRQRAWIRHRLSASGGASIHVNFGCLNDVFLPKVFQNRARSRRAQTICLSNSLSGWIHVHIMFYMGHLETEARDLT